MLSSPTTGRRISGRIMVLAAVAVALPLTATRAIQYVDVPVAPAAAPSAKAIAPVAPVAQVAQVAAPAPVAPVAAGHNRPDLDVDSGRITMNGHMKEWKDLTPAEKAEVRKSLAEARAELGRVNREEIQRNVREAMAAARMNREEFRREMAEARADVEAAMREIDAHSAELRRAGQNPEQIKATVRASLKSVEAIDIEAITRQAMASVDPAQMHAALASAEAGLAKAEAEIERLEHRYDSKD